MKNRYCLLPFQFEKIGEQELLVNELGDFYICSNRYC